MLSEEYSFDSLARQYGVARDELGGQDDFSALHQRFPPDPLGASLSIDRSPQLEDGALPSMPLAAPMLFNGHDEYQNLLAGQPDLVGTKSYCETLPYVVEPNARNGRPETAFYGLADQATGSSSRSLQSHGPSQPIAEPVPGKRVELVPVSSLPELYRSLFSFPFFNAVQSTCLASIFRSPSNLVLSAPTGAGKTVVFELAIIRMLMTEPSNTKAVYLAPTKALCTERTRDWSRRFGSLDCGIIELTGDSIHGLHMARKSRIIVTTPEKWDSLTRRWDEQQGILSTIRLFLIDEVHILNEPSRGARLEVVVTRTKLRGSDVRFVAVSATIPNLEDVARWIGRGGGATSSEPAETFQFGDEYRPCKLERFVYGYPKSKDEFSFQSYLNRKLYDLILTHAAGRPCLVFVATRRSTVQAANILADALKETQESGKPSTAHRRKSHESLTFDDKDLQALSQLGVAFHHAGLSASDRRNVEAAFLAEHLSVVCCTSTLATGVNLPAYCVIIRGTKQFDGQWNELSELDIIQMMGRAGRPQFDRKGVAVIMCEDNLQQKYRELASGSKDIESGLGANLVEHVNAEIGLRGKASTEQMESWLRRSFMWARIQKNPTYYLTREEGIGLDSNEEILRFLCSKTMTILKNSSLITCTGHGSELASTEYGDIMSRFFLRHGTMLALMNLEPNAGTRSILEAVSEAEEFSSLRIRQGEKGYLQALRTHSEIRFPPKQVAKVKDKVMLLIQATLSAISLSSLPKAGGAEQGPFSDVRTIFSHAPRIVKAVMDIAIHRRDGMVCKTALDLARSITAQAWDGSPAMLRQIEHVGEKSIKALAGAGLGTWSSLATSTPARIEMILNRNPPFGSKIIKAAQSVPRIGLDVLQKPSQGRHEAAAAETSGLSITLDITIRIENHSICMMKSKMSKLPLSACVLTLTSEDKYIDFRRMPLWRLDSGKTFTLQCQIDDIRTQISVYAACDEIAGTLVVANLLPADMLNASHRTKLVRARMTNDAGTVYQVSEYVGHEQRSQAEAFVRRLPLTESGSSEVLTKRYSDLAAIGRRAKCKHKCKRQCRHACCQPVSKNLVKSPSDKSNATAQNTQDMLAASLASSSATKLPRLTKQTRSIQSNENLLDTLDRLTSDFDMDQLTELLPLKLPASCASKAAPNTASDLSDSPVTKRPKYNDAKQSRPHEGGMATAESSSAGARPPQRRFLQALSQPSWLSNSPMADKSET
nr:meiosis specific DNA helicase [Farysia itapuensis]